MAARGNSRDNPEPRVATMNSPPSSQLRASAYAVGIVLRSLAVVTFIGTILVAFEIGRGGSVIGVSSPRNPVLWVVGFSGIAFSTLLVGVSETLALLCAVYDRQTPLDSPLAAPTTRGRWKEFAYGPIGFTTNQSDALRCGGGSATGAPGPTEAGGAEPMSPPTRASRSHRPGSLTEFLTRERHFR
jgi:hypothetical protein